MRLNEGQQARIRARQMELNLPDDAAKMLNIPSMADIETREQEIDTGAFISLCHNVLKCDLHDILADPLPYTTPEEWIQAKLRGEISEGYLTNKLGLEHDIIKARIMVNRYRLQHPEEIYEG